MALKRDYKFEKFLLLLFLINYHFSNGQVKSKHVSVELISESDFKKALNNNFNAIPVQINDTNKIEKALNKIDDTYTKSEMDLASNELCKSPRCLISFAGYYPKLNVLVFLIQDYHYEKAVFFNEKADFQKLHLKRFYGSYGVMSKKGLWVGLKREDADNFIKLQICKITNKETSSILKYNLTDIDINPDEEKPIIWVNENTIYL